MRGWHVLKIVIRKVWISILLLVVTFLAMSPTSLLTGIYADAVKQISTCSQMPGIANGPCLTMTGQAGVATDWATVSVSLNPTPTVGQQVTINTVIVALSSPGTFPQNVQVGCFVDTTLVGGGIVTYPGPVGTPLTVPIQTTWAATLGTHKLTCGVATIPAGLDPNKINNWNSITFSVGSVPVLTEITGVYTGLYPGASTSTSLHTTIIGITIPSMYIFSYTMVAGAHEVYQDNSASYWGLLPQPRTGYCVYGSSACPVVIMTGSTTNCRNLFGELYPWSCGSEAIRIYVNFPSNEVAEPVTITVSGPPVAGVTFSWGTEQPASTLAPYTAMPPYNVDLNIYPSQNTASSTFKLTLTGTSHDSYPPKVFGPIYIRACDGCGSCGGQMTTHTDSISGDTTTWCNLNPPGLQVNYAFNYPG